MIKAHFGGLEVDEKQHYCHRHSRPSPPYTVYPNPVLPDIDAEIAVPPLEVNYPPLYVMFNNPRHVPGTVTGRGEAVTENWLRSAANEAGAAIPSQVADKLRGRTFSSFDQFRKAFWQEVAKDPILSKQFNKWNLKDMGNKLSPHVPALEQSGSRKKYELHYVQPINKSGAVYDVDNLRVMTPKRHLQIHSKRGG